MKTKMQTTSLEAYFSDVLPDIGEKQAQVLQVFIDNRGKDFTNLELSRELGWEINRVVGRVHELRGEGPNNPMKYNPLLVESGRRQSVLYDKYLTRDPTYSKRKHIAWSLNPAWGYGGFKID